MKPVDKKDMPKLIALIGLSVCSLGYGIYTLVGGTSVASPPAAATPQDKAAPGATPRTGSSPGSEDTLAVALQRLEGITDPVLIRDPFVITGAIEGAPGSAPAPAPTPGSTPAPSPQDGAFTNGVARARTLQDIFGVSVRLPKPAAEGALPSGGMVPPATSASHLVLPPPPLPPQPPTLTVTGIMVPEGGQGKSIAIVRIKDETRWLSVGEDIGQGFVVRSIRRTDSGSELEIVDSNDKKRHFTFRVN